MTTTYGASLASSQPSRLCSARSSADAQRGAQTRGFVAGALGRAARVTRGRARAKATTKARATRIVGAMCGNRRAGSPVVPSGRRFALASTVAKGEDATRRRSRLDNMFCR